MFKCLSACSHSHSFVVFSCNSVVQQKNFNVLIKLYTKCRTIFDVFVFYLDSGREMEFLFVYLWPNPFCVSSSVCVCVEIPMHIQSYLMRERKIYHQMNISRTVFFHHMRISLPLFSWFSSSTLELFVLFFLFFRFCRNTNIRK